jgi:hypothetical protein
MGGFSSIGDLSGGDYLQVALTNALHSSGSVGTSAGSSLGAASVTQLSPLAQMTSTLGQLQQSDPAKFREVATQLAANLQSDAQTAQGEGETSTAARLKQLAGAFIGAAESGNLPNLQDLIALAEL